MNKKSKTKPRGFPESRRQELVHDATPCELKLKHALESAWAGSRRRVEFQFSIGPFCADFAVLSVRLVIEVDGEYHSEPSARIRDADRTAYIAGRGWRVIRFTNKQVSTKIDDVVRQISKAAGVF